jgi:glycosyltransferase involved in cell wall biosynthesis
MLTACLDDAMRVLVVTSTFPRWAGDDTTPFVLRFTQELIAQGVEVDVLAPHAPEAARDEELDGVPVHRFRYLWPDRAENVCYSGGALLNISGSPLTAAKVPALVGAEVGAIRRMLRARRYDAVSAHWVLPQGWAAVRACRGRTPVVTTVHGSDVFGLRHPVLTRFKRAALLGSDAVTVNSSATREAVASLAPSHRDVRLIPMGVDVSLRPDAGAVATWSRYRRGGGPLVAFVGRLMEVKGVDDLLAGVARALPDLPELTLVIAGTGPLKESLEARARELGLADRVSFVGWLGPADVAALQVAADVVAVPSRRAADGSREAQGLSVVEALALGRPVVAGRVGGIPDAITDGENGLLVPERDPVALAGALTRLATDPALASRLGEAAARSAQRYAWPGLVEQFVEVFGDVALRRAR